MHHIKLLVLREVTKGRRRYPFSRFTLVVPTVRVKVLGVQHLNFISNSTIIIDA
jgi:hypothetical protein